MSSIVSYFSSFVSTVHNDAPEDKEPEAVEEAAAEEEEEEPEDLHPVIRDECKEKRCAQLSKHFEHCQEKVQAGEGFKGEDCVEELCTLTDVFHMMHCIDDCAGPKLFEKLV
ncbi:hypothetical protein MD484_g779, partial [Candolleomyces efflorescens]